MANIGANGFDATHIDPSTDFEHVPAGRYNAEITDSEMRDNSKGTGEYLKLEFTILDGPCAGRKLWAQLNLNNPSTQAVEIAQRELSAICHAVGKLRVQDSVQLHNIPLEINVKVKTNPEYGPQNIIRGYSAINPNGSRHLSQAPVKTSAPAKAESSPQTGGSPNKVPWR
jgi:hypothetical protein